MSQFLKQLKQIRRYPSAVVGVVIILGLIVLSIWTVIAIPYDEAISLWRGSGGVWEDSPKKAAPVWSGWIRGKRLPETIVLDSRDDGVEKTVENVSDGIRELSYAFEFDYPYDEPPSEMILYLEAEFDERAPFVSLTWHTPDGREIRVGDVTPKSSDAYRFHLDETLRRRLGLRRYSVVDGLLADPNALAAAEERVRDAQEAADEILPEVTVVPGTYRLEVDALLFEPESDLETKLVIYGTVAGWAGTDHQRRDLMVALLWGMPIAMAFGLLAAAGTTLITMVIAAVGVWWGGWLDEGIQRVTEINLILPLLPILIMVGTFYSRSIWVILGVVILLSIFGASIKTYRAIFMQVRTLPYIEAAQSYGASNTRIIRKYLVPRILPLLVPSLVILVPAFVFLEASLAVLGLGDPVLPTWGKVIQDARANGALFTGHYYWILEPAALLMLAGLAFAMVGFALDRIFNPRLRER